MSCKIQTKAVNYLKDQGAITDKRVIASPSLFNSLNEELTLLARNKYNVGDGKSKLFSTKQRQVKLLDGNYVNRYIFEPNEALFTILDEAVGDYNKAKLKKPAKSKQTTDPAGYLNEDYSLINTLKKVGKSDHNLSNLAQFLISKIETDITIKPAKLEKAGISGVYQDNAIFLNTARGENYDVEEIIVHEALHYLTAVQLTNFKGEKTKDLEKLFDYVSTKLDRKSHYSLTNLDEFAVGALTSPEFIKELKDIAPLEGAKEYNNLFEEIIDNILKFLGLSTEDSVLEQVTSLVSNIVEDNYKLQKNSKESLKEHQRNLPPLYAKFNLTGEQTSDDKKPSVLTFTESKPKNIELENTVEAKKVRLGTLSEKLDHSIVKIVRSLDLNIERYNKLYHIFTSKGNTALADTMQENKVTMQELREDVKSYKDADRVKAIVSFVETMTGQLKYIKGKIDTVDKEDSDDIAKVLKIYDNSLSAFGSITTLKENMAAIRESKDQDIISLEELEEIEKSVIAAEADYNYLKERMYRLTIDHLKFALKDIRYFLPVMTKHRDRLRREKVTNKIPGPIDPWISNKMNFRDKDMINEDLEKAINSFLEDPAYDMTAATGMFNSTRNSSPLLIQVMEQLFMEIRNKRIDTERVKDREFKRLFEQAVKDRGSNNPLKLSKNIVEFSKEGRGYLKGEFKLELLELKEKYKVLKAAKSEALHSEGINSTLYKDLKKQLEKLEKDNYITIDGKPVPKDKWRNDLSKLSKVEAETLAFFKEITDGSAKDTFYQNTLIEYAHGAKFYSLPKVTKSQAERMWTGKLGGVGTDVWQDLTTTRTDDVAFTKIDVDASGDVINSIPIHYRDSKDNPLAEDQQSLDLFSIYRLEYKNGNTHKLRTEKEMEINMLVQVSKTKKYHIKDGSNSKVDRSTGQLHTKPGHQTEVYKKMQSMLESKLYDSFNKTHTKFGKIDVNKAVGYLNGITSFLGMTFNIASGTANVLNAKAQLFLESVIKGHFISAAGIKKANLLYAKHLKDTVTDNVKPINDSFVNQLNELFDVRGLMDLSEGNFLQADLIKAGLSSDALQILQSTGEHWIQSVTAMAVLDGIKVMDTKSNFIDKEGNIVNSKKEAASMLDMLEKDDKGVLQISPKVGYTTHSRMSLIKEGGKIMIDALIRKKAYDTVGNYTQDDQPEAKRHVLGKLGLMYRNYLIPMGVARLRGVMHVTTASHDLDESQRSYSYALQENEEGTYTSLLRYVIQSLKQKKYYILSRENWAELSDYEKHNIKRAVTEVVVSSVMLPLVLMAMQAMADDDDDMFYFVMYQLRRLDSELSQYRNITELFKLMRSPIPSTRILELSVDVFSSVFTPFDTYDAGKHKDKNKILIKLGKQTPAVKDLLRDYQDLFEFQNSNWGTGM